MCNNVSWSFREDNDICKSSRNVALEEKWVDHKNQYRIIAQGTTHVWTKVHPSNDCWDSVWSDEWTDWQDWPWTSSLWPAWRWPPSTRSCPGPSGPGSIHARGPPRDGRAPSSPTPSPNRCTAAGRWRREQRERLQRAEGIKKQKWSVIRDRRENLRRHLSLLNGPRNANNSQADCEFRTKGPILSVSVWGGKKYSSHILCLIKLYSFQRFGRQPFILR